MNKLIILFFFAFNISLSANQTQTYIEEGCDSVMERLGEKYLTKNEVKINNIVSKKYKNHYTIDASSAKFCGVRDITQGSYNVTRFVKLCLNVLDFKLNQKNAVVYLTTRGDFFCDHEAVLSFDDIWLD